MSSVTTGHVATNCYTIINEDTNEAILIDASGSVARLLSAVKEAGATPKALLLTHAHFDHIWGCNELRELTGAKVYAYEEKDNAH